MLKVKSFRLLLITILILILPFGSLLNYLIAIVIYMVGFSIFNNGQTLGKMLLSIKVVGTNNKVRWYQYFIRYTILYLILIPIPFYINDLFVNLTLVSSNLSIIFWLEIVFLSLLWLLFILEIFLSVFDGDKQIIYDRISHTKIVSSINIIKI